MCFSRGVRLGRNAWGAQLDTVPTPSPRLSGERAGGEGILSWKQRLLTPTLSSFEEERERKTGGAVRECA